MKDASVLRARVWQAKTQTNVAAVQIMSQVLAIVNLRVALVYKAVSVPPKSMFTLAFKRVQPFNQQVYQL